MGFFEMHMAKTLYLCLVRSSYKLVEDCLPSASEMSNGERETLAFLQHLAMFSDIIKPEMCCLSYIFRKEDLGV